MCTEITSNYFDMVALSISYVGDNKSYARLTKSYVGDIISYVGLIFLFFTCGTNAPPYFLAML